MTLIGPSAVIWPSYQNAVDGGKCSWRYPTIIAAPRHGKRGATAESDFSTHVSLFPRFHDLPVRGGGVGCGKTGYFWPTYSYIHHCRDDHRPLVDQDEMPFD